MRRFAREFGFAFAASLVPFAMSVCVFPQKEAHRLWFEMVMSLTLTANTAQRSLAYLRRVAPEGRLIRAVWIGMTWVFTNWALDLFMFSGGPMQMSVHQYLMDIAGLAIVGRVRDA